MEFTETQLDKPAGGAKCKSFDATAFHRCGRNMGPIASIDFRFKDVVAPKLSSSDTGILAAP